MFVLVYKALRGVKMKLYSDIDILKNKYRFYGNDILESIGKIHEVKSDIKLKVEHGVSMCDAVLNTTINSGFFNESYAQSGAVDGLLHDVGRFDQYLLSGTLKDLESKAYTGFEDHGQYGKYLLSLNHNELLRYFIPNEKAYDNILKEVVGEHTTISNPNYQLPLLSLINVFQNYDLSEILSSNNEEIKNKLIALKLLILREEDSLEILHKVRDGLWKPAIGSEDKYHINDTTWEIFTNFGYLDMNLLKTNGKWTCNAGFLLRYSLLYQNINFVGTLKSLLADGTIDKVYQNQINNVTNDNDELVTDPELIDSRLKLAYEYIKLAAQNLIETSPDGKIITDESRQMAKEKTLTTFKKM